MDKIRFLQFSDIHFLCCEDEEDDYFEMRTRFEEDLMSMKKNIDTIQYILICGDIANKGNKDEYDKAYKFISKISNIFNEDGKRPEIFIVPGNHDINRKSYESTRNILRTELLKKDPDLLFSQWKKYEPDTIKILNTPFSDYNDFARTFSSLDEVNEMIMSNDRDLKTTSLRDKKLYWKRSLGPLGKYPIFLYGLNSSMLCDGNENEKDRLKDGNHLLYIPKLGYNITTDGKAINILMIHHPINWMINDDKIRKTLDEMFCVQFFGHMHKQSSKKDKVIKIYSGALQPEPNDKWEYQPVYNIIELNLSQEVLKVQLFSQMWNKYEHCFQRYEKESKEMSISLIKRKSSWDNEIKINKEEIIMKETTLPINEINYKFIHSENCNSIMHELAPNIYKRDKSDRANITAFLRFIRENNMYDQLLKKLE